MRVWLGTLIILAGLGATIAADTIPATGGDIVITQDGVISQNGAQIGKIGVVKFADNSQLLPLAGLPDCWLKVSCRPAA